jgi:hypothetical protein
VDSIAGHISLGILNRGADNRYSSLIDQLGNRNLLQVKNDPSYTLNGKDIFKQYLGDGSENFAFTTITLQMDRELDCPDCANLHQQIDNQKPQNNIPGI